MLRSTLHSTPAAFSRPHKMRLPTALISAMAIAWSLSGQAAAQTELSLAKALQRTLSDSPILQRFTFQEREAEALRLQASIRPAPTLNLSVANAFGSDEFSALDSAEITLSLSQVIELGDKRASRVGLSDARWQTQLANYEIARLEVLAETSRRYYFLLEQQALTANLVEREKLEREALKVITQRQQAGAIGSADAAKMTLRLAQTQMQQLKSKAETQRRKAQLAMMWLGSADFSHAQGSLTQLPPATDTEHFLNVIEASPAYRQKLMLNRLALAEIEQQRSLNRSDVTVGVGVRQFETSNDQALVFDISMPLSLNKPNRGNLAAAYSRQQWADQEQQLTHKQLSLEIQSLGQSLAGYRQQAQQLAEQQRPKAEQLLREVKRGYRQGLYDVLQLVDAQTELFSVKQQQIQLHRQWLLLRLAIERISGQALPTTAAQLTIPTNTDVSQTTSESVMGAR